MRIAILSDIHANLEALEAVLEHLETVHVDECICLGDIVGYGADPNGCIERIRARTDHVVVGNHDHAAVGLTDTVYFTPHAREAARWTAGRLTPTHRLYLKRLPFVLTRNDALCVHSTPDDPEEWRYVFTPPEIRACMEQIESRFCLIGHSHRPFICIEDPPTCSEADGAGGGNKLSVLYPFARMGREARALVNVGSVGQPRDRDPRAAFAVMDEEAGTVEILRVEYDIRRTQRKILRAGLPEFNAERLEYGE